MTSQLVALYESGAITADHLIAETLHRLDPADAGRALRPLSTDLRQRVQQFAREYRPGKMLSNYGSQPTPDQVEAAMAWLKVETTPSAEANESNAVA